MRSDHSGLRWFLFLLLLYSFLINCSIVISAAVQEPDPLWTDKNLQIIGNLTYMGSSSGRRPVDELTGRHAIEISKQAEGCLLKAPYLTSVSQETLSGVLDDGYNVSIGYGTWLQVKQQLYSSSGETKSGTAYYRVSVDRIDTQLLYRPQRAERTSGIIVGGIVLIGLYSVLRWIRK